METTIVLAAVSANLITTVVGFAALIGKVQKAGEWKGWADTKIRTNCRRLNSQSKKIDEMTQDLARHEGAENG